MPFLSKLFGGSKPTEAAPETYQGFTIHADPMRDGSSWRLAARVEKDGQTHQLIRADTFTDRDEAAQASLLKARQVIDEQGDRLFS